MSGFILYYNYNTFDSYKKVWKFYRKRAVRIYPLYWAVLLIGIFLGLYNYGALVIGSEKVSAFMFISVMLGFQCIFSNAEISLFVWFISIILIFYALFPLIIRLKSLKGILLVSSIIFALFYLIHLKFNLIFLAFFQYYWTFIAGIVICWLTYNKNINYSKILELGIISFIFTLMIVSTFLIQNNYYTIIFTYFRVILFGVLAYYLVYGLYLFYKSKNINNKFLYGAYDLIYKISFGSYAIFLFHGTVLTLFLLIIQKSSISTFYTNILVVTVGVPLTLIIGYYIQLLEIKALSAKKPKLTFSFRKNRGL